MNDDGRYCFFLVHIVVTLLWYALCPSNWNWQSDQFDSVFTCTVQSNSKNNYFIEKNKIVAVVIGSAHLIKINCRTTGRYSSTHWIGKIAKTIRTIESTKRLGLLCRYSPYNQVHNFPHIVVYSVAWTMSFNVYLGHMDKWISNYWKIYWYRSDPTRLDRSNERPNERTNIDWYRCERYTF